MSASNARALQDSAEQVTEAQDETLKEASRHFLDSLVALNLSTEQSSQRISRFVTGTLASREQKDLLDQLSGWISSLMELDPSRLDAARRHEVLDAAMSAALDVVSDAEDPSAADTLLIHGLLVSRYFSAGLPNLLPAEIGQLSNSLDAFPGHSSWRIYLRYLEAKNLISVHPGRALDSLAIVQEDIRAAPEAVGGFQFAHDLCLGNVLMALGQASVARGALQPHVAPWLVDGTPVPAGAALAWIEYLMQTAQHAEAVRRIDQLLDSPEDFSISNRERHRLLARRGTARLERGLIGEDDGSIARADLQEGLSLPGLMERPWNEPDDATWRLALLSLAEFDWLTEDHERFLQTLSLAEKKIGSAATPLSRARLEGLRAHGDTLRSATPATRRARQALLEQHWKRMVAGWKESPPASIGIGFLHDADTREVIDVLIELALELDPSATGMERAFSYLIDYHMVGELVRNSGHERPSMSAVLDRFSRPDEGALVFTAARRRSHLFCIDESGIHHAALPGETSLARLDGHWRRKLQRNAAELQGLEADSQAVRDERAAARALASALLDDRSAARIKGWNKVTLVGMEFAVHSGFEWLPLEEEDFLGLTREVLEWPSIPTGMLLEAQAQATQLTRGDSSHVLLAGGAIHSSEALAMQPGLTAVELPAELENLVRAGQGFSSCLVLKGGGLTRAALAEALRRETDLAVFFIHAVQDIADDPERPTALALTSDDDSSTGFLLARDMERLPHVEDGRLAPRFTVLTACRSGSSRRRLGGGIGTDLGSAFLLAGGHVVLTSDIDLLLVPAERFTASLLAALGDGASPARATRVAREELVQQYGAVTPFLFHGLRLVGAAGVAITPQTGTQGAPKSFDSGAWIALVGVLAGGGLAFVLARRQAATTRC